MNILLVEPIRKNIDRIVPDLGLGYLATALRRNGYNVKILDCLKEKITFNRFKRYIEENKFDVVGFKVFTQDLLSVKKSISIIKEIDPSILTIVGGPHPSGVPQKTMEYLKETDFVFKGEAEIGLPLLLDILSYHEMDSLKSVPGLVWRDNHEIISNQPIFVEELDKLGFPSWDLIDPRTYPETSETFRRGNIAAPLITSRGCPYSCGFCAARTIAGSQIRRRGINDIMQEIGLLYNEYDVREINIIDDNFTFDKNFVKDFCRCLEEKKLNISWSCPNGVRLDTLDEELLDAMKSSGCYALSVGIESGSDRILKEMRKNLSIKEIKEKIEILRESGLLVTGFFILGYPMETLEEIKETIKFSLELDILKVVFNLFVPLLGTQSYEQLERAGFLCEKKKGGTFVEATYSPPTLSLSMLKYLQRIAYIKFYLRPKILFNLMKEMITQLRSFNQIKFLFRRLWLILLRR